jgi:hypothetical protein
LQWDGIDEESSQQYFNDICFSYPAILPRFQCHRSNLYFVREKGRGACLAGNATKD